jgi:sigma-54 dependent transcriptional regulator, flagellar regulatory protein
MKAPSRLTAEQRAFFAPLGEAIFLNPFGAERATLLDRASPGHSSEALRLDPNAYQMPAEVDARLSGLERQGRTAIQHFAPEDRAFMQPVLCYQVYHRHVPSLDRLIQEQLKSPNASVVVPFARSLLEQLSTRGLSLEQSLRYLAIFYQLRRAFHFIVDSLTGEGPSMQQLRLAVWNAVFTHNARLYDQYLWNRMEDFSTLLIGETGTGKGLAAAAIGRSGLIPFDPKAGRFAESFSRSFLAINLSQFPESLIESELFGHRKGSFTGAVDDHAGVFERCSAHGALFLDEIGEASVPIQIKLLQVLQERTYTPVGGRGPKRFSGRIIAATNRSLASLREQGNFRDDVFYRLCSQVIILPTLRQRLEESPAEMELLVASLVARTTGAYSTDLSRRVLEAFARELPPKYLWPGNVRELEQAIRRVLVSGHYSGYGTWTRTNDADALAREMRLGALTAQQLQARYCALLYRELGTLEAVARRTGLDRRTVKKYIQSPKLLQDSAGRG